MLAWNKQYAENTYFLVGEGKKWEKQRLFPQRNLRLAEKGGPTKQPILPRVTQTSGDLWDRQWSHSLEVVHTGVNLLLGRGREVSTLSDEM